MKVNLSGIVFDRAIVISDADEIKTFGEAPADYVMKSGMYDGLDDFNGIWFAEDGERMDNADGSMSDANHRDAIIRARNIYIVHSPAPNLNACKSWVIIIYQN
jgi:hypothetical protein